MYICTYVQIDVQVDVQHVQTVWLSQVQLHHTHTHHMPLVHSQLQEPHHVGASRA